MCCIFRRSLDLDIEHVDMVSYDTIQRQLNQISSVLEQWREMATFFKHQHLEAATIDCLDHVDEAMSVYTQGFCTRMLQYVDKSDELVSDLLVQYSKTEEEYLRKISKSAILTTDDDGASYLIRIGHLKKFVSSVLYLEPFPDKTLKWIRQLSLSLAAALAMLWAVFAQIYAILELGLDITKATSLSFLLSFTLINCFVVCAQG